MKIKEALRYKMETMGRTDRAYQDWDKRWQTAEGRKDWLVPETEVQNTLSFLKKRSVHRVLDLGCGIGRHALFFAKEGFVVHAMDGSPAGVDLLCKKADEEGLRMDIRCAEMTTIPFETGSMDYVLAWNVIYHGDLSVVKRVVSEILRIIKPGGLFQGTMLSKRHADTRTGHMISKDTYVQAHRQEKMHPHYYCNAADLIGLLHGFDLIQLRDGEHRTTGSYHWHFLAEKS